MSWGPATLARLYQEVMGRPPPEPLPDDHPHAWQWRYRGRKDERERIAASLGVDAKHPRRDKMR